jgi:hypothetical protein
VNADEMDASVNPNLNVGLGLSAFLPFNAQAITQPDGSLRLTDANGNALGTARVNADNDRLRVTMNEEGYTEVDANGVIRGYDKDNNLRYTQTRRLVPEAGENAIGDDIKYADGRHLIRATVNGETHEEVLEIGASYEASLYQGTADFLAATIRGDSKGQVLGAMRLAATWGAAKLGGDLGQAFKGLGAGLTLLSGIRALQSDDFAQQVGGVVSLLRGSNDLTQALGNEAFLSGDALKFLDGVGAVLSIANLAHLGDMLDNGQVGTAALTIATAANAAAYLAEFTTALTGSESNVTTLSKGRP